MDIITNLIKCTAVRPELKRETGLVCGRDYTIISHIRGDIQAKLKIPWTGWISTWYLTDAEIAHDRQHSRVDGNGPPHQDFVIYRATPSHIMCDTKVTIPPGGVFVMPDKFYLNYGEIEGVTSRDAQVDNIIVRSDPPRPTPPHSYAWSDRWNPAYPPISNMSRFQIGQTTPPKVETIRIFFDKSRAASWNST